MTLLQASLAVVYSLLVPLYKAPDEPQHVDMVGVVLTGQGWPENGSRQVSSAIRHSYQFVRREAQGRGRPADEAPARANRPTFVELAEYPRFGRPGAGGHNPATQHPPLYYVLVATGATVVTGLLPLAYDLAFDQTVALYRLLGALFIVPLPLLCYLTARGVLGAGAGAAAAAVFPLAVPGLFRLGAAVNNDGLVTLLIGIATYLAVKVAAGDRSRATAGGLGVAAGLAMLTKGFALFAPALIVAAYAIGARRFPEATAPGATAPGATAPGATAPGATSPGATSPGATSSGTPAARHGWSSSVVPLLVSLAVMGLSGGWWWLRNLLILGTIKPAGLPIAPAPDSAPRPWWPWVQAAADRIPEGFWGYFPGGAAWPMLAATAVTAATVGAALALRRRERVELSLLLLPTVAIAGMMLAVSLQHYGETVRIGALNGRYLYPALVGLATVAGAGLERLSGTYRRWLPLALLALAGGMHLWAGTTALLLYWGPPGGQSLRAALSAMVAWAPWPTRMTLAALAVTLLSAVATAVALAAATRVPSAGQRTLGLSDHSRRHGGALHGPQKAGARSLPTKSSR